MSHNGHNKTPGHRPDEFHGGSVCVCAVALTWRSLAVRDNTKLSIRKVAAKVFKILAEIFTIMGKGAGTSYWKTHLKSAEVSYALSRDFVVLPAHPQ